MQMAREMRDVKSSVRVMSAINLFRSREMCAQETTAKLFRVKLRIDALQSTEHSINVINLRRDSMLECR